MLFALLADFAARAPRVPVLRVQGRSWHAAELAALADGWAARLRSAGCRRFALCMRPGGELVAALAALSRLDASVVVLKDDLPREEMAQLAARLDCEAVVCDAASFAQLPSALRDRAIVLATGMAADGAPATDGAPAAGGSIRILTSGTTGVPKAVAYRWRDLVAATRMSPGEQPRRWLLAYSLAHFAGIQVLLHALVHRETLIVPPSLQVPAMWEAALSGGATHISSTPTFWRMAFASPACERPIPTLRHVTLGGEAVTQDVLDRIAAAYPGIGISQVYASTELGSVVSVRDGRAGLPLALFDEGAAGGPLLRVVESELQVRVAPGQYRPSGDLVQRTPERVLFLGRRSETINVGGVKVHPQQVEAVVNPVEGVAAALADGRPNPVTGQIVRLRVVLRPGHAREDVEPRIRSACRTLGRHAQPRQIVWVDSLATANMKLARGSVA
jgi:acyl-CoA synthetase (AMP-forming)/AMP-acid ligase II